LIEFRLDTRSGVAPYLQLAQQVRHSIRLGYLRPGDQLPRVKDVVSSLAINPNTVLKAYRELEREGLVEGRPGVGTFVMRGLDGPSPRAHAALQRTLERWVRTAFDAGLDPEAVRELFESTFRNEMNEETA
jgi:GntR family transcriptional regulator